MLQRNEFSIKKAMLVVMRNNKTHKLAKPLKPSIDLDNIDISADVPKQCTLIMAYIVQQDDTYLPIFKHRT